MCIAAHFAFKAKLHVENCCGSENVARTTRQARADGFGSRGFERGVGTDGILRGGEEAKSQKQGEPRGHNVDCNQRRVPRAAQPIFLTLYAPATFTGSAFTVGTTGQRPLSFTTWVGKP